MASLIRPSMLRRGCLSSISKTRSPVCSRKTPLATSSLRLVEVPKRQTPVLSQVAAFHASTRKEILKPLPQVVQGTMNDPAPIPPSSPTHGSYHWTFERLVAAGLIPLTVAPFAAGSLSPVVDAILCAAIIIHSHIGFQAMIIDYIPQKRLPKTRTFSKWFLRASTLTVAVGLYEFETNDVGVTETIKRIWKA